MFKPRAGRSLFMLCLPLIFSATLPACAVAGGAQPADKTMNLDLDARELHRRLLHARIELPVSPGPLALWYPKWIPGIHGPRGPIENVAGLRISTTRGQAVPWKRDDLERYKFHCTVPRGLDRVVIALDYICNQPSVNSVGVDSYGNSLLGCINFNTCILYPDGIGNEELFVRLRLRLPAEFRFATSLPVEKRDGDTITFKPVTLREVIDSPLICGKHFRSIDLSTDDFPETHLHLTSEAPAAIQIDAGLIDNYKRLVTEAKGLFTAGHFPHYHLLVTCSDDISNMGLEHLYSSLNGVGERDLIDKKKRKGWAAYLLAHEFVHAWCGKYRRPAGMFTRDYHTDKRTNLLWIYEGLTQYLGEVLTIRCGLLTPDEYLDRLAYKVDALMHQKGRQWRSLEDTAVAAYQLRGRSKSWNHLRRGQDYYNEGLIYWLEADALIRAATDNRRSLDDFCAKFFGPNPSTDTIVPFELDEVLSVLSSLADHDWKEFFDQRVASPRDALPLDVITRCGYRLQYATEPSEYLKGREEEHKYVSALASIGMNVANDGTIGRIVPDSVADRARLAPGTKLLGVNGRKFSAQRFKDAVADSVTRTSIELLALAGDEYRTVMLDYAGGPRYLQLVRDESKPDILSEILRPRGDAGGPKNNPNN